MHSILHTTVQHWLGTDWSKPSGAAVPAGLTDRPFQPDAEELPCKLCIPIQLETAGDVRQIRRQSAQPLTMASDFKQASTLASPEGQATLPVMLHISGQADSHAGLHLLCPYCKHSTCAHSS
jgi:hypothetical protein